MNVGREFLRHFYGSVGIGYVDNQSTVNDSFDSTLVVFYNDQYEKITGFASVKFDNTDDFYLPREGFIAALNFELAQMDGVMTQENLDRGFTEFDDFAKINGRFGIFQGMEDWIDYDLILRAKVRFTKIVGDDEYLPIAERLFMGGTGSVRGYDPYSISPTVAGERIGGTERVSSSLEASIPLSQAAKMRLAFFYDYGIIGSDPVPTASGIDVEFDDIARSSTGVVLEWQSAFGPINLIFAYPIDEKIGDRTSVFEFTMGTKF